VRKNAGAKQGELTKIVGVGIEVPTTFANTQGDLTSPRGSSAENTSATIPIRLNHGHIEEFVY
jgi:hypothetical protein